MGTTTDVRSIAEAINRARPDTDETDARIIDALYRLLGQGKPVAHADLSAVTGLAENEIVHRIGKWPGVYRDDRAHVIGFWGLTVAEMPPHEIILDGRKMWAWCAWDTLFLPRRLGESLDVHSVCPVTGRAISLRVSPKAVEAVDPDEVVVSFLEPNRPFDADVIGSFCHYVHFFANTEAGEKWTSEHPGTFLISLEEAFELGVLTDETRQLP